MTTTSPEGQSSGDTSMPVDSTTSADPTMSADAPASIESAISAGMASGDNEAVMRALAVSVALLPQAPPEEGEERPEGAVALPVIEQDGTQYIPIFTSVAALEAAGADAATAVRLPLAQLAANWPSDDLWLAVNPSSAGGLTLPAEVVRALPVFASLPDGTVVADIPVDDDTEVIVATDDDAEIIVATDDGEPVAVVDITDDGSSAATADTTTGARTAR
jgi:hypothetical protein